MVHGAGQATDRIAAYGIQPLAGSGSILTLTVRALEDTDLVPFSVEAVANEGQVPVRVSASRTDRVERGRAR